MAEQNQAEQNNGGYLDDYYDNNYDNNHINLEYLYGAEDEGVDMESDSDDDEVEGQPVMTFLPRSVAYTPPWYNYEEYMQYIINIL